MYSNVPTILLLGYEHLRESWASKCIPKNVYNNTVHNSPNLGIIKIQMSINVEKINILWYMDPIWIQCIWIQCNHINPMWYMEPM